MRKFLSVIAGCCIAATVQGQSYHFSQAYSAPILINPASTGFFPGDFRISANFRSQWAADRSPFLTTALGGEYRLLRDKLPSTSIFGAGVTFLNDMSMARAIQNNSVGAAVGYHIGLDDAGIHSLGAGVHGTFNTRRIDISRLSFENQFGPGGYDPSLPIGEDIGNTNNTYFDVNAGLMYNADFENKSFFLGASIFNSFEHADNILDKQFKMPRRFSVQVGASFQTDAFTRVYFSGNTMQQAEVMETTVGMAFSRNLLEGSRDALYLGLWYRVGDALFPYVGYELAGFRAGLSVDVTMASNKSGASVRNAVEMSLVFSPWDAFEKAKIRPWY